MGQLKFVLSMFMIGLFTIALIGFAINFAEDNDAVISLADDSDMVSLRTDTKSEMDTTSKSAESSFNSLVGSSVEQGETLESGGAISLTIKNIYPVTENIIRIGFVRIFGAESQFNVFLTAFIGILLVIGTMYFIKTWLGRNPD